MLDKHLSSWFFLLTVNIVCISLSQNESLSYSGYLTYIGYVLSGMHGFFLYVCTKSLNCYYTKDFKREHWMVIAYGIVILIGLVLYGIYPQPVAVVSRIVAFLLNGVFIVLAVRLFHHYKRFLETNFSNIDKLSFNWMKFLAFGLIIVLSGAIVIVIFRELFFGSISLYNLFAIVVLLFVNLLGFRGIKSGSVF